MATVDEWQNFYGPNAGYVMELYERYQADPNAVDAETRAYFAQHPPDNGAWNRPPAVEKSAEALSAPVDMQPGRQPFIAESVMAKVVGAARLARSIREYGHMRAQIDPLGNPGPDDPMLDLATHGLTTEDLAALPASIVWRRAGPDLGSCLDAIQRLEAIYCGTIGYDIDHIQDYAERAWLIEQIEQGTFAVEPDPDGQRALLQRLTEVEEFEQFLHTTFQGQKRFSLEGSDMLVPMLDELIAAAGDTGTREILIGMAHRGRLNVLAHILGKPYAAIFAEFHHAPNKELVPSEGSRGINEGWTGDVKYHLGGHFVVPGEEATPINLTLAHNPSHLEFVNPVVEGFTRAAQEQRARRGYPQQDVDVALAVTIHGDAAFPGEGVVAETLNLSRLPGYQVGGTIHIIVNNQIGFTTGARDARSTLYASDLAKGYEIPIAHVNGDDVAACLTVMRLAHAYRQRFHKDFLVDLVSYRRWGHNEGDDPTYTQPLLYATIQTHPTTAVRYAKQLQEAGVVSAAEHEQMIQTTREQLHAARQAVEAGAVYDDGVPLVDAPPTTSYTTAVPEAELRQINAELLQRPADYTPNAKLERILGRRGDGLDKNHGIDWGHAEALAFATIVADGTPIRLTGQDSERGTFVQRHAVLNDSVTGAKYVPIGALSSAEASFAVYNSPLSEAAPLGFEYGYTIHAPETLVIWEAQFGDFANAGQVLIDQFIAAARAKWRREPALVLLLPHGYEGQGPEHSSGRVERYLQLAAEDNLRVTNPTTAGQYFHLLRLQAASLRDARRPLVVMTPKSLLRHPYAGASLSDLTEGGWQPVLDDPTATERRDQVTRLLFCSGKVSVDLFTSTAQQEASNVAIARLEQLYPFPTEAVVTTIAAYPQVREICWVQEEPQNMGGWSYVALQLEELLTDGQYPLRYIGRPPRASTAEGSADVHAAEQARIVAAAFASTT